MKTFVILGCHRSATSLVAKGLHEAGVDMGVIDPRVNDSQPQGHYENHAFVNINSSIIVEAGGEWYDPPPREAILSLRNKYDIAIRSLINHYQKELWGWKDPRTILTIDLYLPYLISPIFMPIFRNISEV